MESTTEMCHYALLSLFWWDTGPTFKTPLIMPCWPEEVLVKLVDESEKSHPVKDASDLNDFIRKYPVTEKPRSSSRRGFFPGILIDNEELTVILSHVKQEC